MDSAVDLRQMGRVGSVAGLVWRPKVPVVVQIVVKEKLWASRLQESPLQKPQVPGRVLAEYQEKRNLLAVAEDLRG